MHDDPADPCDDSAVESTRATRVRRRYPIIDAYDTVPSTPIDVAAFDVLEGRSEALRVDLERAFDAAVVVYASSHRPSPHGEHQLCKRATAARLTDLQLDELRRFEAQLEPGQVACAYRWPRPAKGTAECCG